MIRRFLRRIINWLGYGKNYQNTRVNTAPPLTTYKKDTGYNYEPEYTHRYSEMYNKNTRGYDEYINSQYTQSNNLHHSYVEDRYSTYSSPVNDSFNLIGGIVEAEVINDVTGSDLGTDMFIADSMFGGGNIISDIIEAEVVGDLIGNAIDGAVDIFDTVTDQSNWW